MLLELHVRNFAIAEQVDLEFESGFNVLTGETGAGKSIVIDAITFLIGGRAGVDMIRTGTDSCLAEALFDISHLPDLQPLLDELGLDAGGDELILTREMSSNGRSRCRANGRLITVSALSRIGEHLVNIHGQHDHQSLLRPETHLGWLDLYAGDQVVSLAQTVSSLWHKYHTVVRTITEWEHESRERERRKDLLRFQLDEIDHARLKVGEDAELQLLRQRLANAERLMEKVSAAYTILRDGHSASDGVLGLLGEVTELLTEASAWEPELRTALEMMESAFAQAQEATHMLRHHRDMVQADPEELIRVEERLALIAQLRRKYGDDVADILGYREQIAAELDTEEMSDNAFERHVSERNRLHQELMGCAVELSRARKAAATKLSTEMKTELAALALENAEFLVRVEQAPSDAPDALEVDGVRLACTERGIDKVELQFSANPGESPRPLAKVASGGELSRTMLALKSLLARHDSVPTLIFDEVDTGIGGRTAGAVAQRIAGLSAGHQVLVVTHLAQIACVADHHLHVEKAASSGRTNTSVRILGPDERVQEIARMLDGTTSETTLQRARELLGSKAGQAEKPKKAV